MLNRALLIGFVLITVIYSCKKATNGADAVNIENEPYILEYGTTLPAPNLPMDNPLTKAKVQLGRMLFYEKSLSGDNTMACATCHKQENAFSDVSQFSIGIDGLPGKRQAMAIMNMAWNSAGYFWDGRASTLRQQSLMPIQDVLEMHETLSNAVDELASKPMYKDQFKKAFGSTSVTSEKISLALEAFMLTMVSGHSKYDQYLAGQATLNTSEENGRKLFFAEYNPGFPNLSGADCAHCHSGSNFENNLYMNNALDLESDILDFGHMNVTSNASDKGKFKVPTLRNIAVTFPYMHDGRFTTLEQVIDHYNSDIRTSSTADPALMATQSTGLMLTSQDKADLVNFLKTLTDNSFLTDQRFSNPH
ncbi:MAG: cytochrome c peroxidase [Crocinitomicaceae bacterium]